MRVQGKKGKGMKRFRNEMISLAGTFGRREKFLRVRVRKVCMSVYECEWVCVFTHES